MSIMQSLVGHARANKGGGLLTSVQSSFNSASGYSRQTPVTTNFVFATGYVGASNAAISYLRNTSTGVLTVASQVTAASSQFNCCACTPDGKFAFFGAASTALGQPNYVHSYSVNSSTGALTLVGTYSCGNAIAGGNCVPLNMQVATVNGSLYLYVFGNSTQGGLFPFAINTSTGALTLGTIYSRAQNNFGLGVSPDGLSIYGLTNNGSPPYYALWWPIDQATGNPVVNSVFPPPFYPTSFTVATTSAQATNQSVIVSPDNANVYFTGGTGNNVFYYNRITSSSVGTIGQLTGKSSATGSAINNWSAAISPNGMYYYVCATNGKIDLYYRNTSDGSLTFSNNTFSGSVNYQQSMGISPDGKFLYANVGGMDVWQIAQ